MRWACALGLIAAIAMGCASAHTESEEMAALRKKLEAAQIAKYRAESKMTAIFGRNSREMEVMKLSRRRPELKRHEAETALFRSLGFSDQQMALMRLYVFERLKASRAQQDAVFEAEDAREIDSSDSGSASDD